MTTALATLITYLANELPRLMESGENWQLVLHGGKGGDVDVEIKQTKRLLRPPPIKETRQG